MHPTPRPCLRIAQAFAPVACALLLDACSTTLSADDYDTSCGQDSECVTVGVGDMCECSCDEGAINASDLERYRSDRGDIECSVDCGPCPELSPARCNAGTCEVAP